MLCSMKAADCQELTSEELEYEGLTRTYLKYIPAGFDGNNSLPLVMSFHGGTGNGNEQLAIADMRDLADQDQFILVYPDAYPEPLEGETNWQVVVSGDLPFTVPTAHDDIGFVDVLIDADACGARHRPESSLRDGLFQWRLVSHLIWPVD